MKYCKNCRSEDLTKNGLSPDGCQKYKCKSCGGTYRVGDSRLKYSMEKRIRVIKMYLEGLGITSISRLENISGPLIIYWIKNFGEIIRNEGRGKAMSTELGEVKIMEIDDLFNYYQKKSKTPSLD